MGALQLKATIGQFQNLHFNISKAAFFLWVKFQIYVTLNFTKIVIIFFLDAF